MIGWITPDPVILPLSLDGTVKLENKLVRAGMSDMWVIIVGVSAGK